MRARKNERAGAPARDPANAVNLRRGTSNRKDVDQIAAHVAIPASVAALVQWALVRKEASPYSGTYPIASNYSHLALFIFKYKGKLCVETSESAPEQLVELRNGRYAWHSANAAITFDRDTHGHVTALSVLQNGQVTPAKKAH